MGHQEASGRDGSPAQVLPRSVTSVRAARTTQKPQHHPQVSLWVDVRLKSLNSRSGNGQLLPSLRKGKLSKARLTGYYRDQRLQAPELQIHAQMTLKTGQCGGTIREDYRPDTPVYN